MKNSAICQVQPPFIFPLPFSGVSQHWNPSLLMISWETWYVFSCECIRHTFYRECMTVLVSCLHCEAVAGTSRHQHSPGGRAQMNHINLHWSLSLSPFNLFLLPFLTEITSRPCTKTFSNSLRSHPRTGPGPHQIPLASLHWKWGLFTMRL